MRRAHSLPLILGAAVLLVSPVLFAFCVPLYRCPDLHGYGCGEGITWKCRTCGSEGGRITWFRKRQFERQVEENQRCLAEILERIDTLDARGGRTPDR